MTSPPDRTPPDVAAGESAVGSDAAEELVFRCLESADPEAQLALVEGVDPALAARARQMLAVLQSDGMLTESVASEVDLPEQLGPYRLGERLGTGGMGLVFAAEDVELQRRVAVKLIRPDMVAFARPRQRFENEITALARLDHPNIARVLRAGEEGGLRYYAMEFVDGESLTQVLARCRGRALGELAGRDLLPAPRDHGDGSASASRSLLESSSWADACVLVVRDVALALAHAHGNGILHRDIKPGNVMLGRDGRVRLLDFGLARQFDAQTLTRSGALVGSLAYMSPEQLRGDRRGTDERSDVFGLGVLLYELLTLRSPFLVPDHPEQTRQNVLRGRKPALRRLNPSVGRAIAAVCRKAMATDPEARHSSAAHLAGELDALRVRATASSRVGRWLAGHVAWSVGGALAAVTAVLVLATMLLQERQVGAQLRRDHGDLAGRLQESEAAGQRAEVRQLALTLQAAQHALDGGDLRAARQHLDDVPRAQRSFVWSLLDRQVAGDADILHAGFVENARQIRATHNGYAFVHGKGNMVCTVDPESGRVDTHDWLDLPSGFAALSSDGRCLLHRPDGRRDRVSVQRLEQSEPTHLKLSGPVRFLVASPVEDRFAALYDDGAVEVRDFDGNVHHRFEHLLGAAWHGGARAPAAFSPDGKLLIVGNRRDRLACWNLETSRWGWGAVLPDGDLTALTFDPVDAKFRIVSGFRRMERRQLLNGRPTIHFDIDNSRNWLPVPITDLFSDGNGSDLWLVGFDGRIRCMQLDSRRIVADFPGHDLAAAADVRLLAAALDPYRDALLVANARGEVHAHDLAAIRARWIFGEEGLVRPQGNSRGDVFVVSQRHPPILRLSGQRRRVLEQLPPSHRALYLDDDLIVMGSAKSGELLLYDLGKDAVVDRLLGHTHPVHSLAQHQGRLLSGDESGVVRVWGVAERACLQILQVGDEQVGEIVGIPGGDRFACATRSGRVVVASIGGDEPVDLLVLGERLYALAVSPDGRWLVAGGRDDDVSVYDLAERRLCPSLRTGRRTASLAFSPDGRRLVVASHRSERLEVFDVETWDHLISLGPDHGANLHYVGFSEDGAALLTSDYGSLVRVRELR